jgi:hypothetical protein
MKLIRFFTKLLKIGSSYGTAPIRAQSAGSGTGYGFGYGRFKQDIKFYEIDYC